MATWLGNHTIPYHCMVRHFRHSLGPPAARGLLQHNQQRDILSTISYHITSYTIPYHTIPYTSCLKYALKPPSPPIFDCHNGFRGGGLICYRGVPYHSIPYHTISYLTIPYHFLLRHLRHSHGPPARGLLQHHQQRDILSTISYHITSYHIISYHTMP